MSSTCTDVDANPTDEKCALYGSGCSSSDGDLRRRTWVMVSLVVKLCGEERRKVARDQMKRRMNVRSRNVRLATTLEIGSSSLLHVDERGPGRRPWTPTGGTHDEMIGQRKSRQLPHKKYKFTDPATLNTVTLFFYPSNSPSRPSCTLIISNLSKV